MSWDEKDFEESMHCYINDIYYNLFKNKIKNIYRSDRSIETNSKLLFMDKELAIDTHLTFKDGSVLTFQEKTLQNCKKRFNAFTFEYYNDPKIRDEGEWFKLAAQLYFFGYANLDRKGYEKYWIINVAKLRTRLMSKFSIDSLELKYLRHNKPPAKANFFAIPFSVLEKLEGVILYKYPPKKQMHLFK